MADLYGALRVKGPFKYYDSRGEGGGPGVSQSVTKYHKWGRGGWQKCHVTNFHWLFH
jgi:hypothetical protein